MTDLYRILLGVGEVKGDAKKICQGLKHSFSIAIYCIEKLSYLFLLELTAAGELSIKSFLY